VKRFFVFAGGFGLALCSNLILEYAGPRPFLLWILFLATGMLLGLLPKLNELGPRLASLALYASVFALLWVLSSDPPGYTPMDRMFRMVAFGLVVPLAFAAVVGYLSVYRTAGHRRATMLALLLPFCLTWLIAFFSSGKGGAGGMIDAAIHIFGLSESAAHTAVLIVRKGIHFTFYGVLAWAAWRAARVGGANLASSSLFGALFTLCHASFDEMRQASFSNRTSSVWDVVLDMAGAVTILFLAHSVARVKRPRRTGTAR
jgi:hypothetical protein